MEKRIYSILLILFSFIVFIDVLPVNAQMMSQSSPSVTSENVSQTRQDELAGQNIYKDLTSGTTSCDKITDGDFEKLGEYFMGQAIGNAERHAAMNQMMTSMMGENGEEQMHINMGKRLSGCDPNAQIPAGGNNFIPMFSNQGGGGNPMMGYGGWGNMMGWGFGVLGWLSMLIFLALLIIGAFVLIRYLGGSTRVKDKEKSVIDILKERYARGEIDKKEFEEKKKDLG